MLLLRSNFTNGLPGLGLLLLRVASSTALSFDCWRSLKHGSAEVTLHIIATAAGGLLLLGLWTRVTGAFACLVELGIAFGGGCHSSGRLLLASLCAVLALLGPGCWSVDARLFGWKRIHIPRGGGK